MPLSIGVALCTHNGSRYLLEQLDSILAQTVAVSEIVISDDHSTDGTLAVIEQFQKRIPATVQLTLLQNPVPLGVTKNFEQALKKTTTDIVFLSDQDDVWLKNKVESLVPFFSSPDTGLVHTDALIIDDSGRMTGDKLFATLRVHRSEIASEERGDGLHVLLKRNIVTGATCAVRRDFALSTMPFPSSWLHDEWLAIQSSIRGGLRVSLASTTLYRVHTNNQIGAHKLSTKSAVARLTSSRRDRNHRLLNRANDLLERENIKDNQDKEKLELLIEKVQHEAVRSGYPEKHVRRIVPVLSEVQTGRYWKYGGGLRDILRDLVQPSE